MARRTPPARRRYNPWITGGVCAALSLVVHGGALLWVHSYRAMLGRTHSLVDALAGAPIESTLVLAAPPPVVPTRPEPVRPEPPATPPVVPEDQAREEPARTAPGEALLTPAMIAGALDTPRRRVASALAPAAPAPAATLEITPPGRPVASESAGPITFAGVAAERASRIVYVVDASGPMASSLPFVVDELSRSIESLGSSQQFQVILFRSPPVSTEANGTSALGTLAGYEMFTGAGDGLLSASRETKDRVRAWLTSIRSVGRSDPLPGLRAALSMKPDLVFLLSRSIKRSGAAGQWGAGAAAILSTLDRLNPVSRVSGQRAVVIKTIQFLDDDPTGLLRSIAAVHGDGAGSYRVLELAELTGPRVTSVGEQP